MTLAKGEKLKASNGTDYEAPLFYRTYKLETATEANNDGEWATWSIQRGAAINEIPAAILDWKQLLQESIEFRGALLEGKVRGEITRDEMLRNPAEDQI
jgi:hypothetical protein